MANLQIKDLPEELHEELRRRARLEGITVRAYVLRLIEADQELPTKSEWLAQIRERRPVDIGGPAADLINADREERFGAAEVEKVRKRRRSSA
jgi:plasmid stability protein